MPPAGAAECVMLRVAGFRLDGGYQGLLTRRGAGSTPVHVGVVVDIVALDKLFSKYFCFAPSRPVNRCSIFIHRRLCQILALDSVLKRPSHPPVIAS